MIRKTLVAMLLALAPMAPAAAVITISASPAIVPELPAAVRPAAPRPVPEGMRFGEFAAAGLGVLVLVLAFGTSRLPPSVTA